MDVEVSVLVGKVPTAVAGEVDGEVVEFKCSDGSEYRLYHSQDCCESVRVAEIHGDLNDLVGVPILQAERSSNSDGPAPGEYSESWTWTFYRFTTIKGAVTLRWLGESNGYYSESVDFAEIEPPARPPGLAKARCADGR